MTAATATADAIKEAAVKYDPTDQAVLDYLKLKGMGTAVLELTDMLATTTPTLATATGGGDTAAAAKLTPRERLDQQEASTRNQHTLLTKSTGGGYGYDRDATWQVVQWGIPDTATGTAGPDGSANEALGAAEARSYLEAFCTLQLWVLSLPDTAHSDTVGPVVVDTASHAVVRAQQLLHQSNGSDDDNDKPSLPDVVAELVRNIQTTGNERATTANSATVYALPPSAKPELLSVTFALLVHTYCELLEVGMEGTAHTIRDAFRPVYQALYPTEFRDLEACATTEDVMRLNTNNSQHMDALNVLKQYLVQMASFQMRREELSASSSNMSSSQQQDPQQQQQQQQAKDLKLTEYDRSISILRAKYNDLSKRVTVMFHKLNHLPFLRRARAVRWQLNMSTTTYGLLTGFLNSTDDAVLAMSTLLQTKCELHVERRDPLPFTPACVLAEDQVAVVVGGRTGKAKAPLVKLDLNDVMVNWAAPAIRPEHTSTDETQLPYPKYHLQEEYEDEPSARKDKRAVEFNRALLVNGFRRLEALERKREYESLPAGAKKLAKEGYHQSASSVKTALDPFKPTIMLSTLCAGTAGPILRPMPPSTNTSRSPFTFTDPAAIWDEAGIGLCCAKVSPPDGRRVAVGCDDSAVRIWNVKDQSGEPTQVLLGHKNGFPVFDVDWNRDGRTLLSAGGDGSIRLWDTMAVGPFGEVTTPKPKTALPTSVGSSLSAPDITVPGLRPENAPYSSGAALAVYRGHAPSSPVWAVSFAPSGYYFASAGGDATARLWTTDRPVPVRLFTGHSSSNVNCVEWHPNCNYIVTGSDDKTVRLWDIQTGQTVRLLNVCAAGINAVKVSPGGRYVAGADYSGVVHLWDLGSGKKVTEFRTQQPHQEHSHAGMGMIHALDFSNCGTALATGGDDGTVRIWDVRADSLLNKSPVRVPTRSFGTRQTLIMDLSYTKRNLLLSVGKVVTPVPLAAPVSD